MWPKSPNNRTGFLFKRTALFLSFLSRSLSAKKSGRCTKPCLLETSARATPWGRFHTEMEGWNLIVFYFFTNSYFSSHVSGTELSFFVSACSGFEARWSSGERQSRERRNPPETDCCLPVSLWMGTILILLSSWLKVRWWSFKCYIKKVFMCTEMIKLLFFNVYPGECLSPPHSPDFSSLPEFKENKEPSPKVKRRRSVKISSAALEPAQWQNDDLQILTCASDYKSMNEFLMKKVLRPLPLYKLFPEL